MSDFRDRTLRCADCGSTFVFTAGEQAFYEERGFSEPKRCPSCRAARKAGHAGGGSHTAGRPSQGRRERPPRQMYTVVCADCGQTTQVPFKPSDDRPVYCRDCYERHR
ncbi:MAG: zinc-ribbon domain containing protein [Anaerolineae bacterium]